MTEYIWRFFAPVVPSVSAVEASSTNASGTDVISTKALADLTKVADENEKFTEKFTEKIPETDVITKALADLSKAHPAATPPPVPPPVAAPVEVTVPSSTKQTQLATQLANEKVWLKGQELDKLVLSERDRTLTTNQVKINGVIYPIILDENKVARFRQSVPIKEWPDLIQLTIDLQEGKMAPQVFGETLMNTGYSINGWSDAIADYLDVVVDYPGWHDVWKSSKRQTTVASLPSPPPPPPPPPNRDTKDEKTNGDEDDDEENEDEDDESDNRLADGDIQLCMNAIYYKCEAINKFCDQLTDLFAKISELRFALQYVKNPTAVTQSKWAVKLAPAKAADPAKCEQDLVKRLKEAETTLAKFHECHTHLVKEVTDLRPVLWAWWNRQLLNGILAEGRYVWLVVKNKPHIRFVRCRIKTITKCWKHTGQPSGVLYLEPSAEKGSALLSDEKRTVNYIASYDDEAANITGDVDNIWFMPSPLGDHIERTLLQATFNTLISFIY